MQREPSSLRDLFDHASDLAGGARDAFVRALSADQRAHLEPLLAAADVVGGDGALDVDAAELARALDEPAAPPMPGAGQRVGPWQLLSLLGEGGSSTVFRAEREHFGVRQEAALKLLRRGLYTTAAQRQFRRERQALAQLHHPDIARLIEGGVTEHGLAYIVLELVDGVPINFYARNGQLDLRGRLLLFLRVCRAVESAHRALIVHRDLKPSNVLVTAEGHVKLLDFGIAKLLDADDETQTKLPAFTPAYAAPEQRSGGPITTATDVYALGVLLGELLTGQRLTGADGRTPSGRVEEHSAPGVLPASPKVTRRQLRGDLDNIVLKATAEEPARRYASAGSLAGDIERLLDGRPVIAHPPSRWYRARKFAQRHRGGVAVTTLFLIAILLVAVALTVIQRAVMAGTNPSARANSNVAVASTAAKQNVAASAGGPEKSLAVLAFDNLSENPADAYLGSGLRNEVMARLADVRELRLVSLAAGRPDGPADDVKSEAARLGITTVLEGSVQKAGDDLHIGVRLIEVHGGRALWAQRYDCALKDLFAVERDTAQHVASALDAQPMEPGQLTEAPTQNAAAYELYLRASSHFSNALDGLWTEGYERDLAQAVTLYAQAFEADPKFALAAAMAGRAIVAQYAWIWTGAADPPKLAVGRDYIDRALALQPDLPAAHVALGFYHLARHDDAQALYELEFVRRRRVNDAEVLDASSQIAMHQGRWRDAISDHRHAMELAPRTYRYAYNLAYSYVALRHYGEAVEVLKQAQPAARSPELALIQQAEIDVKWRGDVVRYRGIYDSIDPRSQVYNDTEGERGFLCWLERDYAGRERLLSSADNDDAVAVPNFHISNRLLLGWTREAAGKSADARRDFEVARGLLENEVAAKPNEPELRMSLAYSYAGLGLKDAAMREAQRVADLVAAGHDQMARATMLVNLGMLYARIGEKDRAIELVRQTLDLPAGFDVSPATLRLDPMWDGLRGDARFEQLAAQDARPLEIR